MIYALVFWPLKGVQGFDGNFCRTESVTSQLVVVFAVIRKFDTFLYFDALN